MNLKCLFNLHDLEIKKEETTQFYWKRTTYKCRKCKKKIVKDRLSL